MAFTKKFKKFIGVVAAAGIISGGIYYTKVVRKAEPQVDMGTSAAPTTPQSTPTPTSTVQQAPAVQDMPDQAPASTVTQASDPSENRGMKFLLNQGKN